MKISMKSHSFWTDLFQPSAITWKMDIFKLVFKYFILIVKYILELEYICKK